ncbi:aminotransferase class V-fold PLP-dependent enzyme [Gephyromycinifex aptenodytis]|uniref:aminotransferase class V-fold PLP-dependent enzyme n=1 Tax=Gephyromycinifex aptenodytis TaxID=2716227 RepID=UPI001446B899|nr:aminotransferase class V-fold PLP-dependent enzyme [Gephyromycinifex aptenodytis]
MNLPRPEIDPDGLLEYSVVFTDRALNHMSRRFISVMQEIDESLKSTYNAHTVALVPGGGTYAMEAVARQLATKRRCLVIRNGFFSYRWSQIFETGGITDSVTVCQARPLAQGPTAPWAPAPIDEVVATIARDKPELVFAAHVETAAGMLLPPDYLRAVATATHEAGGMFVLDCIASGAIWVDMQEAGVDILISAPQKGWSGTPCAGFVMLNESARAAVLESDSTSFAIDLKKWLSITEGYAQGKAAYHATMPTDALAGVAQAMRETRERGLEQTRNAQLELGQKTRALLAEHGYPCVAADSFAAPSVVVAYTDNAEVRSGAAFAAQGMQIAAGVPLMCGEPEGFSTFRLGLFGLDKLADPEATLDRLASALDRIAEQ